MFSDEVRERLLNKQGFFMSDFFEQKVQMELNPKKFEDKGPRNKTQPTEKLTKVEKDYRMKDNKKSVKMVYVPNR